MGLDEEIDQGLSNCVWAVREVCGWTWERLSECWSYCFGTSAKKHREASDKYQKVIRELDAKISSEKEKAD